MAGVHGSGSDERSDGKELCGNEGGKIRWFKYVTYDSISDYEARGWRVSSNLGPPHGHYAILMELTNDGGDDSKKFGWEADV